jgi:hypothetical protein
MDAKTGANIKTGTITLGNKTYSFPIYDGTIGPEVLDVSKLYAEAGIFTYDPGFTSTGSCESKITYIDGDQGILLYRGYPIADLAEHGDFLETCYLLLYGELPSAAQKADFVDRVTHHTMIHEQMSRFFQGFRRDAHPMAVMVGCVGALSAFYHDSIFDRPTIRISEQQARLCVELPAHVFRGALRGIQGQSRAVACDGSHFHPARRPRAECLDFHGSACGIDRRQSVCLHRGGHRLPVGPGAWRRQ